MNLPSDPTVPGASRRAFLVGATVLAAAPVGSVLAEETEADFLFVQTAKGMSFDKAASRLTLTGVSPVTLFFTDRPERIAGNMSTGKFVPFWSEGPGQLPVRPAERRRLDRRGRQAAPDRRGAEGSRAFRRGPELHRRGDPGRDAGERRRGIGLHRHHRPAADARVLRGRGSSRLPQGRHILSARHGARMMRQADTNSERRRMNAIRIVGADGGVGSRLCPSFRDRHRAASHRHARLAARPPPRSAARRCRRPTRSSAA